MRTPSNLSLLLTLTVTLTMALSALVGCEGDDPNSTPSGGTEAGVMAGVMAGMNAGMSAGTEPVTEPDIELDELVCAPLDDDYPSDAWAACISDGGRYELVGDSTPTSAARIVAFEQIADLLWRREGEPSSEDFIQAELLYAEAEGLQSRVARRYDSHIPKPEGADCSMEGAGELWPEYCVGPALIDPLISDAFLAGVMGEAPRDNAARVKAGLLWFSYVSAYKEANTCVAKAKDCDSHWAYTNGAMQRDETPLGFGAWVKQASEVAYDQLFDAHLAVRCWRDLDDGEVAEDQALIDQALGQIARALDQGLAFALLYELSRYEQASEAGDALTLNALKVELEILGPVLWRALLERNPEATLDESRWSAQWASLSADDISALRASIEGTFGCP